MSRFLSKRQPSSRTGRTSGAAILALALAVGSASANHPHPCGGFLLSVKVSPRVDTLPSMRALEGAGSPLVDLEPDFETARRGVRAGRPFSWEGMSAEGTCVECPTPDPRGDVGPNHYVQVVSPEGVAIYSKTGELLVGPFSLSDLWATGPCTTSAGEPTVNWDPMADRWVLGHAGFNYIDIPDWDNRREQELLCVAVSQTSDPAGAYSLYELPRVVDIAAIELSVWPSAYYATLKEDSDEEQPVWIRAVYALDRKAMVAGTDAMYNKICEPLRFPRPADLDGAAPAVETPGLFYLPLEGESYGETVVPPRLRLFEFVPDFANPANATWTRIGQVDLNPYQPGVCPSGLSCLRQRGTDQRLNALASGHPTSRLVFRRYADHDALAGVFTVGGGSGESGAAPHWFELRKTGAGWSLHTEGTHDPGDGHDRTLASLALDGAGNMAIGYSTTSSAIFPRIDSATRRASESSFSPEATLLAGTGSNSLTAEWGEVSSMVVDPVDDCTFYFTSQYFAETGSTWRTRVGALRADRWCGREPLFFDDFESSGTTEWSLWLP